LYVRVDGGSEDVVVKGSVRSLLLPVLPPHLQPDLAVPLVSFRSTDPTSQQYQVRLFCTSDTNWNVSRPAANQFPAPIEFPASAEIKLNGAVVPANVKGIKKQPGTAPPVNLSAAKGPSVILSGAVNRVEVNYVTTDKVRICFSTVLPILALYEGKESGADTPILIPGLLPRRLSCRV
jgi:hypothetical protein